MTICDTGTLEVKWEEILVIVDKHKSNVTDKKRQGKDGTRISAESQSFQESTNDANSGRTDWDFLQSQRKGEQGFAPCKAPDQGASPAGNIDSHSLELNLCIL